MVENEICNSLSGATIRCDYRAKKWSARLLADPVPSKYDLTPLPPERPDPWDVPWLFACTASLASCLQKTGKTGTCSEFHALNALYEMDAVKCPNTWGLDPAQFGYFGDRRYALAYLTRGDGGVPKVADPNLLELGGRLRQITDDKPQQLYVKNAVYIPDPFIFPDPVHQFILKQHLVKYGAVSVMMYYDEKYKGSGDGYYCKDKQPESAPGLRELIYHSVIIIGWDDNYDVSNFKGTDQPGGKGAFQVRDCMGTGGVARKFWVSYEDVEFGREAYCFQEIDDSFYKEVRKIYQHDLFGFGEMYPVKSLATEVIGRNVFARSQVGRKEELEAVGFYVAAPCKCNFVLRQEKDEIKLNDGDGEVYQMPGYYTYKTKKKCELVKAKFEIDIKFTSLDGRTPVFVPVEKKDERTVHLDLKAGESFIDGVDVATINGKEKLNLGHVCIKAIVADKSAEALNVNEALSKFVLPSEEKGMWLNLPILDTNGVGYDWSRLEPASEGTATTFRYHTLYSKSETRDYGLWVNTDAQSRRIVTTLVLKKGDVQLKKLIDISLSVQVIPVITLVKVAKYGVGDPCYRISGDFPVLGANVKISSSSKANPKILVVGDSAHYPQVVKGITGKGEWTCDEFRLLNAKDYDPADKDQIYRVQAAFLDKSGNQVASSGIQEQKIDLPFVPIGPNNYEVDSWFGLVAALVAFFAFLFGIIINIKCPIVVPPSLPGGGGVPGTPKVGRHTTLNGRNHRFTRLPGQPEVFEEISGTLEDTMFGVEFLTSTAPDMAMCASGGMIGVIAKKICKSGKVKNCSTNIKLIKGCDPALEIGGIATENNGTIENCTVMFDSAQPITSVGGITVKNTKDGVITGCTVTGDIQGEMAGGIALTSEGDIRNCTVRSNITGSSTVGGICSELDGGTLQNNVVAGSFQGDVCGGVIGKQKGGKVNDSKVDGTVTGKTNAGGICGEVNAGALQNNVFKGEIQGDLCGGIAGKLDGGMIHDCKADGTVTGKMNAGGICGEVSTGVLQRNFFAGQVKEAEHSGGIVGKLTGIAEVGESAVSVELSGKDSGGGIVGALLGGCVHDCYSVGTVSGNVSAGGVAGDVKVGAKVQKCYTTVAVNMGTTGLFAGGVAGVAGDSCIQDCVAVNSYVDAGAVYRIAKGKQGDGCRALTEMQAAAGSQFLDMGEKLLGMADICKQAVFSDLGWDFLATWNMDDLNQFPKLSRCKDNASFRHPFLVIDNALTGDHYTFKYGELVKFSGYKNQIVTKLNFELEVLFNQANGGGGAPVPIVGKACENANAGADGRWEEQVGWLEKGTYRLSFLLGGDHFNVTLPVNFTVE